DLLTQKEFTVVGICQSPLYMNFERGNTTLGSGKIGGFVIVPRESFDPDQYTEIYVITDASKEEIYTKAYDDKIDTYTDFFEEWLPVRAQSKYEELYSEAQQEIDDAWEEIHDAEKEIEDAKIKIADGEQELIDGQQEIEDGEQEILDAEQEIADAEQDIADAQKKIKDGEKELADAKTEITEGEEKLTEGYAAYNKNLADYQSKVEALEAQKAEIAMLPAAMQAAYMEEVQKAEAELQSYEGALVQAKAELDAKKQQLEAAKEEVALGEAEIKQHKKELKDGEEDLEEARTKVEDGKKELADARNELEDGKKELEDARQELADGEAELADAKIKLEDGEEELAEFEEPDTFVLSRNTNIGYVCFDNDSAIVEGIGNVFPVFFFLVAALVCMTTMNRMIEEQRTQIGVMKALGYSEGMIMGKYLFYAGTAANIGAVAGFLGGSYLFPLVIWEAYSIMYTIKPIEFVINPALAILSLLVAILCSVGATFVTLDKELREQAAELIRPKAPATGRRVFLEYIDFIWKRMSFISKVSVRNAFRYKKRFFMMILGVGGCYGLLITGFGIKDSIADVCDRQFIDVQKYDLSVTFEEDTPLNERLEFEEIASSEGEYFYVAAKTVDADANGKVKSLTLVVLSDPEEEKSGEDFISFQTEKGEKIPLPEDGEAIITSKLARNLGLSIGDRVVLRDPDLNEIEARVSGIMQNYVYNWAYINEETYREERGEAPDYNTAYVKTDAEDTYALGAKLGNAAHVSSVSVSDELSKRIDNMMQSLNQIVLLVIFCAGMLAFIVMYNLTNINITERLREIATLKVLGFYSGETAVYVFRENVILTALGCVVGLFLGYALHRYVMFNINVDAVSFDVKILPQSYLIGIALTFLFALIVDLVLSVKLEKIKMAESLKSVE
ncbi:MAG: FtsX-like permease family protein, partial [Lachnospiraceae bacterium]|nr:FtsX-like permease family protein [Lachnospiraceae bacterium]